MGSVGWSVGFGVQGLLFRVWGLGHTSNPGLQAKNAARPGAYANPENPDRDMPPGLGPGTPSGLGGGL